MRKASPFTGNGFTGTEKHGFVPEYQHSGSKRTPVSNGADLWVNENGVRRLVAVFNANANRFAPTGEG